MKLVRQRTSRYLPGPSDARRWMWPIARAAASDQAPPAAQGYDWRFGSGSVWFGGRAILPWGPLWGRRPAAKIGRPPKQTDPLTGACARFGTEPRPERLRSVAYRERQRLRSGPAADCERQWHRSGTGVSRDHDIELIQARVIRS